MCIIVDANVAADMTGLNPCAASSQVVDWLTTKGSLVVGGKLTEELQRVRSAGRLLVALKRAGRLITANDQAVAERTTALETATACISDDPHVIALAQVSGARLLYSKDQALHADFCSATLLSAPRGSVYQATSHRHLLSSSRCSSSSC